MYRFQGPIPLLRAAQGVCSDYSALSLVVVGSQPLNPLVGLLLFVSTAS